MRVHATISYEVTQAQVDSILNEISPIARLSMSMADVAAHDLNNVLSNGDIKPERLEVTVDHKASSQAARIRNDLDALDLMVGIDDDQQRQRTYGTQWPRLARMIIERLRLEVDAL